MGPQRTGVHPRAASICNRNVRYLDCALGGHADGWFPRRMETLDSCSHLLLGTSCTFAVLLTIGYLMRSYVSRLALGYFVLLLISGFLGVRCLARLLLRWRHKGGDVWRVIILGSGRVAQEVASKIEAHPEMLCRVVG